MKAFTNAWGGESVGVNVILLPGADQWRDVAACSDPVGTTGPALDQIAAAKRVCGECPATDECLEYALATNQDTGVWGGRSEEERRQMRKARRAAARTA